MFTLSVKDERGFNQGFSQVGSTVPRMRRRHDWFVAQVEKVDANRVLELGCGTGETAAYIAAHSTAEVVAVDISPRFIDAARANNRADNLRYEVLDLLGEDEPAFGCFDMVCGNGILHHLVPRLPDVLSSLRRLTNAGGALAFIEPNFLNPYCAFIFGTRMGRRFANLEPEEMAFTPHELRTALPEAGWKDVDVATKDFLLPGMPERTIRLIEAIEPLLEATPLTRWLAQSHFVTASA